STKRGDVDLAVARPVELAEEDALVAAEGQAALLERHKDFGAHQRRTHVRGRIRAVRVVVAPAPAVLDDLLHGLLEVVGEGGIDVLVDGHAGGRVRHVDQRCGGPVCAVQRRLDLLRDVEELRPPLSLEADLVHPDILRPMPSDPPPSLDLDAYRASADRFIAELDEEESHQYAAL